MIDEYDIKKLAKLARLEISNNEEAILQKDMGAIVEYISQITQVVGDSNIKEAGDLRNVVREDSNPHKGGIYSEKIMNEVPDTERGFVKVKQIL